jgi:hypothetical protein
MFLEFNIDVRFVASFVMRYRLSVIDCSYGHHIHLGLDLHRHRYRQLFRQTIPITPSPPDPPISYLGKTKNKKRNSLAHPRPGHHHPPDLFRLCALSESDEVDEGAGLVGRRGFLQQVRQRDLLYLYFTRLALPYGIVWSFYLLDFSFLVGDC